MRREPVTKPTKGQRIESSPLCLCIQVLWDLSLRTSETSSPANPDLGDCILKRIKILLASPPWYLYLLSAGGPAPPRQTGKLLLPQFRFNTVTSSGEFSLRTQCSSAHFIIYLFAPNAYIEEGRKYGLTVASTYLWSLIPTRYLVRSRCLSDQKHKNVIKHLCSVIRQMRVHIQPWYLLRR